ncbi:MAG: cyclic-di-AMP receptor [Lactobacillus sp.]|uniref:Transcriptional regulator n=1 Tax=Bombilactobacillus bombi TaxID=1303590 RepID=A0A3R6ZZ04_9LACO|nr:cyclic-di-AMP receptor [Bombilactobacillus bombi]MCO6541495.1 cyclic-di-AMP receptor [Lactobacillus sp.]MCO6543522.1 cyclic-di-AMP receptor [Lactobacillus sp.]RHW51838.1 hypothetical protein DS831_00435 [Bombilactobacillus bombi]
MKLVIAFVQDKDCNKLTRALNKAQFRSTRLATTGGFLKSGNSTLILGIEDEQVDDVLTIIKEHSHTRKEFSTSSMATNMLGEMPNHPIEVVVGGATVLIAPLEKMVRF